MDNMELVLQELRTINGRLNEIDGRLDKIESDVSDIKEDLAELKEAHTITREGVNTLLDWADDVAVVVKVPLKPAN